jgi:hypothetical protein
MHLTHHHQLHPTAPNTASLPTFLVPTHELIVTLLRESDLLKAICIVTIARRKILLNGDVALWVQKRKEEKKVKG